jgi:hypothetical protein
VLAQKAPAPFGPPTRTSGATPTAAPAIPGPLVTPTPAPGATPTVAPTATTSTAVKPSPTPGRTPTKSAVKPPTSGGTSTKKTSPAKNTPELEQPAQDMLNAIKADEPNMKNDRETLIERYRENVIQIYPGTKAAAEAAKAIERLQKEEDAERLKKEEGSKGLPPTP